MSSDILVENYLPGTLRKYQMDYETIHKLQPRYEEVSSRVAGLSFTFSFFPV
jgi:crotonobetainyl-CoA:carnitine CoA-transferase CaiB-like acyl-CoA transferase